MNPIRRDAMKQIAAGAAMALGLPRLALAVDDSKAGVVFLDAAHPEFAKHRAAFNKRITLTPKMIAVCSSEAGVIEAVRYATREKLAVAIKSGGHSFEGFSLNDGGLVIDLSAMNGLVLNAGRSLQAGPGCRLSQVNDYLLPRGRLIPAGTCGGVGLGGLTLGGGYGFFSRRFGLTCDSLKRVRVVDAEGKVHDSGDEPELLWACRGGGTAGLGVVTQLDYATHPAPKTLHSFRYRYRMGTAKDAVSLAARWAELMRDLPREAYSAVVANTKIVTILVTTFLPDPREPRLSKVLATLAADASKVEKPTSDPLLAGTRRYVGQKGPLYFKNASGGFYNRIEDLGAAATDIFHAVLEQPGIIFQINTFGPLPAAPESAFPHRDFAFIGELQAYWDKPSAAVRAIETIRRLQRSITAAGVKAHYANYPDIDLEDWAQAYYGPASYARLQAIKNRLDPADVFRHPQSVR